MIEQTSSIVISIGARSCALRFGADTSPKFVGMISLPGDQTIDRSQQKAVTSVTTTKALGRTLTWINAPTCEKGAAQKTAPIIRLTE